MSSFKSGSKTKWAGDDFSQQLELEPSFTEEKFLQAVPRIVPGGEGKAEKIDPRSGFLLSRIDGKATVAQLFVIAGMSRRETIQRLRDMYLGGLIDFGPETPAVRSFLKNFGRVLSEAEKEEIRRTWARVSRGDDFSVLGLNPQASPEEVRRAYWELSRRYHPDRYSGIEMGQYEEVLKEINVRIAKAYHQIQSSSVTEKTAGSGKALVKTSGSSSDDSSAGSTAEMLFLEAEKAWKSGDIKDARAKAKLALNLEPANSKYRERYLYLEKLWRISHQKQS